MLELHPSGLSLTCIVTKPALDALTMVHDWSDGATSSEISLTEINVPDPADRVGFGSNSE
jgi:hypothetical protein